MRWLLTVAAPVDLGLLRSQLADLGVTVVDEPPVPIGTDEQVVAAEGPGDLPTRLRAADTAVRHAHPDSPLQLY